MLHRKTNPTFVDLIEDEFAQERRRRLADWDGRSKQDSPRSDSSTPAMRAKQHRRNSGNCGLRSSARQVSPSGISQCSARLAGSAICATCSAITACRRRLLPAWASCLSPRQRRAGRTAAHRPFSDQIPAIVGRPELRTIFASPVSAAGKPDRILLLLADLRPKDSMLKGPYA